MRKIKLFINKYNWKGINFPSVKDNWKKCQRNNRAIVGSVFYANKKEIYFAYASKHNSTLKGEWWSYRKKQ